MVKIIEICLLYVLKNQANDRTYVPTCPLPCTRWPASHCGKILKMTIHEKIPSLKNVHMISITGDWIKKLEFFNVSIKLWFIFLSTAKWCNNFFIFFTSHFLACSRGIPLCYLNGNKDFTYLVPIKSFTWNLMW